MKKHLIQADRVDAFHDYRLENFDRLILQTHLNQLARDLGFPKLNFQVIRRTIATLGKF